MRDRRAYIGGSDAPVIMGVSRWKTPLQLYAEKAGLVPPDDLSDNEAVAWGSKLEDIVREHYISVTGRVVTAHNEFVTDQQHAFIGGEPDAIVLREDGMQGVLEVKTTNAFAADDWEESAPIYYRVQLQHYLMVTGYTWGSFAVLIGGQQFRWLDEERNEAFIARLREMEVDFWRRVQENDAPDAQGPDAKLLAELYKEDEGREVALPGEALAWDQRLAEVKAELKALSDEKAGLESRIKQEIGEATFGVLPNGTRYSWKTQKRDGFTVQPSEFRVLRRKSA